MVQQIAISSSAAERLAQLQQITGHSIEQIMDYALADHLAHLEFEALRAAVLEGVADAEAGRFADKTVAEIFAEGIAQAETETAQQGR